MLCSAHRLFSTIVATLLWGAAAAQTDALPSAPAVPVVEAPSPAPRELPTEGESVSLVPVVPARETPAPTPAPAKSPALNYSTPFSLNDCINVLGAAVGTLPDEKDKQPPFEPESYLRMLDAVSNYLKDRDDLHFTWLGYEWQDVARKRVSSGLIENIKVEFDERDCPRGVTAISFVVENEDVYLHSLKVYDYETAQKYPELTDELAVFTHQFDQPIVLRHSLPKLTFFHLLVPADIGVVDMAVSQVKPDSQKTPRVVLRMGRTDKPEYVKMAIWDILQAQRAIRASDYPSARASMESSQSHIRQLRNSLRLSN